MDGQESHEHNTPLVTPETLDLNSDSLINQIVSGKYDNFSQTVIKYDRYGEKYRQSLKMTSGCAVVLGVFKLIILMTLPESYDFIILSLVIFLFIALYLIFVPAYQSTVLFLEIRKELKSIAKASNLDYKELQKEFDEIFPPLALRPVNKLALQPVKKEV